MPDDFNLKDFCKNTARIICQDELTDEELEKCLEEEYDQCLDDFAPDGDDVGY